MLAAACGGFSIFWLTSACQTSCASSNQQPIDYVDGKTHTEGSLRIYETTPLNGEWLHFPSNRRFRFEHNLHTTSYTPVIYVAFGSHPIPTDMDASGDVAVATGDVAIIEQINPDSLMIRNDTCSEQYLYVKIIAPNVTPDAGLADSGVSQ
jgi:hypothetical protein